MLDIMLFGDSQRRHIDNDRGAVFMSMRHLLGQVVEVRVAFPNADRVTNATFPINNQELSIFSVLARLEWLENQMEDY